MNAALVLRAAAHRDFFWAAVFLAPSCLLVLGLVFRHGMQRFRQYSVTVEAEITDVERRRSGRSWQYRPVYSFFYQGESRLLPDVSWSAIRVQPGTQRMVRIDPLSLHDVFDPVTYRKLMLILMPLLLFVTTAALYGLTQ